MALGAAKGDVLRMILADGARMTCIGIASGIIGALLLTRVMAGLLFGVRPTDLATFSVVVIAQCLIAALACYVPARRAMKIDPLVALRDE